MRQPPTYCSVQGVVLAEERTSILQDTLEKLLLETKPGTGRWVPAQAASLTPAAAVAVAKRVYTF